MITFLLIALFLSNMHLVASILINRTIDDFYGDEVTKVPPSYLPIFNGWNQGNLCDACIIDPATADISQIFNGTWHDSTWHVGNPERVISMNFTGVAVYAFVLLVNQVPDRTTFTNLTFRIDGELAGNFTHWADNTTEILYNVPAFGRTGLPSAPHVFEIHASGGNETLVLFDYAVYTTEDTSSPSILQSPSSTPTASTPTTQSNSPSAQAASSPESRQSRTVGPIVGSALGVFAFGLIAAALFHYLRKRHATARSYGDLSDAASSTHRGFGVSIRSPYLNMPLNYPSTAGRVGSRGPNRGLNQGPTTDTLHRPTPRIRKVAGTALSVFPGP